MDRPNLPPNDRRAFIQELVAMFAAAGAGLSWPRPIDAIDAAPDAGVAAQTPPRTMVGMQVGPHTMLDEGIERSLDLIQKTAGVNTIFVYSHVYGGDLRKAPNLLAPDHGVPVRDQRTRNLPLVWVKQHDQYFKDTTLRHPAVDQTFDHHERDLFTEMMKPLRARGMKVYARILEAGPRGIVNFSKVATVNVYGKPTQTGCWNHPEYIGFWRATVEDLFRSYELDGFQWGAERASPLTNVLQNGTDTSATCFCEFCRARARGTASIPSARARASRSCSSSCRGCARTSRSPPMAWPPAFLRILIRNPEILAWDFQYRLSREGVMEEMYRQVKDIKPSAPVGWHVDHWATSMDLVARSAMSYAEMAPWSDYLKVVVYHAVTGPRIRTWVGNVQRSVLGELTLDEALGASLRPVRVRQDPDADVERRGETRHVAGLRRARNATECGERGREDADLSGNRLQRAGASDDADTIYEVVKAAYAAGANGVVASREYEEMTVPNLTAFGRAVREVVKTA